jgi:hypothetical protein
MQNLQKLPPVIMDLIEAQNRHDVEAFVQSFAADAIVNDEGQTYQGSAAIKEWNKYTNEKYNTHVEPIGYTDNEKKSILRLEVSGSFEGSPLPLNYSLVIEKNKIQSLQITG